MPLPLFCFKNLNCETLAFKYYFGFYSSPASISIWDEYKEKNSQHDVAYVAYNPP